jgi:hypothetical protein
MIRRYTPIRRCSGSWGRCFVAELREVEVP